MYNPYTSNNYSYNYGDMSKLDRLNYLQSTNPQLANNYQNPTQPFNSFSPSMSSQPIINFDCKPVTSVDEAKASPARLDGNPVYMIDINAKSIYEKRLDMNTGAANFNVYKLVDNPENLVNENQIEQINYENIASKEDLIKIDEKVSALSQKQDDILLNLRNLIMNGDGVNESNANVNGSRKSKPNASTSIKK